MNDREIADLANVLYKFYEVYKKDLSASERHALMKLYLTVEFFEQYMSRKTRIQDNHPNSV